MRLTSTLIAALAATAITGAAHAATVTESQTQILESDGQDLTFTFAGLAPSDGTGGTLTVASGINEANPGRFDGLDLNEGNEFFEVLIEGTSFGNFNCSGVGGNTAIPGSDGDNDCDFSLPIALSGTQLDEFLADGVLTASITFSAAVGAFAPGERDQVNLSLSYEALAPVPLPASGLLLLAGLGAMAARRCRS